MVKVSVIIPVARYQFLRYLLPSLASQTYSDYEVVFVIKNLDDKIIEKSCHRYPIKYAIIQQKKGFFTGALNLGKKNASGDLLLFTDDDVILPNSWIKKYVKLHEAFKRAGAISSRDLSIYGKNNCFRLKPLREDRIYIKLYHWFIKSIMQPPHPLFRKYVLGIYLTKDYRINYGLRFPNDICFSLPFRGANMSFKKEAISDHDFPEHPLIKRGLGNEQYIGIVLVLDGWESIYTPQNPVLHFWQRETLSRFERETEEIKVEKKIMKNLIISILKHYCK
ncbi:MAG: glycosyltransferase family A protein [Candidatus Bathyarchaeia archaeon]